MRMKVIVDVIYENKKVNGALVNQIRQVSSLSQYEPYQGPSISYVVSVAPKTKEIQIIPQVISSHRYVLSSQFNQSLNLPYFQLAGKEAQVHVVGSNSLETTYCILFELSQGPFKYYVSMFLAFLTPPIYLFADVILKWSLTKDNLLNKSYFIKKREGEEGVKNRRF